MPHTATPMINGITACSNRFRDHMCCRWKKMRRAAVAAPMPTNTLATMIPLSHVMDACEITEYLSKEGKARKREKNTQANNQSAPGAP